MGDAMPALLSSRRPPQQFCEHAPAPNRATPTSEKPAAPIGRAGYLNNPPPLDDAKPVAISIDATGSLFVDGEPLVEEQLPDALQNLHTRDPEVALTLRADTATDYGRVARVLADVQRSGITRLAVITESP
ncbi:TonB system transport protein ExbD [Pseudomonas viridiflava]|uniref:TonB system transport protein ExbD n=2 Tax=Pseudomonas viridiflava TaxID=33069 RepID=A0A3M5P2T7_PSEVI|nr:TonB system transport protein ExbD [Pseudomonas viridiflava]